MILKKNPHLIILQIVETYKVASFKNPKEMEVFVKIGEPLWNTFCIFATTVHRCAVQTVEPIQPIPSANEHKC